MGAWGSGVFENDTAQDFLHDYEEGGAGVIEDAFATVEASVADGYIDADNGSMALVAAEIVAAAFGKPLAALSKEETDHIGVHFDDVTQLTDIQARARTAATAILGDGVGSELFELWDEAGQAEIWRATVADLLVRLA
jgi:hypothetical protein